MRISHTCAACGTDLRRTRATREPHYGLPLVICPTCETAVVRRRHPVETRSRQVRGAATSLAAMILQLAMLASLVGAAVWVCNEVNVVRALRQLRAGQPEPLLVLMFGFIVVPVVIGAWLSAGLGHCRQPGVWLAFAGMVLLIVSTTSLGGPALTTLAERAGMVPRGAAIRWGLWTNQLANLGGIMGLALLGIPFGAVAMNAERRTRRKVWRSRRRRLRARSVSA